MDQYDRVIRDIQRRTSDGVLQWAVVSPSRYERILTRADRVVRAFRADYPLGMKEYSLLFVQRKTESHDELGYLTETIDCELYVLDRDGEIVLPLYDGVVERGDLSTLAGLIDAYNDRVK